MPPVLSAQQVLPVQRVQQVLPVQQGLPDLRVLPAQQVLPDLRVPRVLPERCCPANW